MQLLQQSKQWGCKTVATAKSSCKNFRPVATENVCLFKKTGSQNGEGASVIPLFSAVCSLSQLNVWNRGDISILCGERRSLGDYTTDWNVKELSQLPITSVRTFVKQCYEFQRLRGRCIPERHGKDNKEASLKVKEMEIPFIFLSSLAAMWLTVESNTV